MHLVELILKLHGLFLVLAQLLLQVFHFSVFRFRVLLAASALKLQCTDQFFSLLLRLVQVHALVFQRFVLASELLVFVSGAGLKLLKALLCLAQVEGQTRVGVL